MSADRMKFNPDAAPDDLLAQAGITQPKKSQERSVAPEKKEERDSSGDTLEGKFKYVEETAGQDPQALAMYKALESQIRQVLATGEAITITPLPPELDIPLSKWSPLVNAPLQHVLDIGIGIHEDLHADGSSSGKKLTIGKLNYERRED